MRFVPVEGLPAIHVAPAPQVSIDRPAVVVEVDDGDDGRMVLVFEPLQAVRITTIDAWRPPDVADLHMRRVSEVESSDWIEQLRASVSDSYATFMDYAHHFFVPGGDLVIEVVAWQLRWQAGSRAGAQPADVPEA